jgi:HEAT repeat protein
MTAPSELGHHLRAGRRLIFVAALAAAPVVAGCAGGAALEAAERGDFIALRAAIKDEASRGNLSESRARALARAVAAGEVERARGRQGATHVGEFAICAREIDDELDERSDGADEVAPAAAMVRLEARLMSVDSARDRADEGRAKASARHGGDVVATAWRAVGARALVEPEDASARRKLFEDGDQDVRLAALRAATDAGDPRDADALLEAARVEPFPLARTVAVRAAGAVGGERVVLGLKDLWAMAEEPIRIAIADAWANPRAASSGGTRELAWAAQSDKGAPGIAAAAALVRVHASDAPEAIGVMTRAVESGPSHDRIYAIGVAPLTDQAVRAAVVKAESDRDESVALAAMARLIETPPDAGGARSDSTERRGAVKRLLQIANANTTRSLMARGALARAGAREVVPYLQRDVRSMDLRVREAAGTGLAEMGELALAVPLVADPDEHIRTVVSCSILSAPPRR